MIATDAIRLIDHRSVDRLLDRVDLIGDPLRVKAIEARQGDGADSTIACEPL